MSPSHLLSRNILDEGFEKRASDFILRKYLGEQPPGVGFVLRNKKGPVKHVVCVSLFRILTVKYESFSRNYLFIPIFNTLFCFFSRCLALSVIAYSVNEVLYIILELFNCCRGDSMAWLDPGYVPQDYAYTALRAALISVLRHNAANPNNPIRNG